MFPIDTLLKCRPSAADTIVGNCGNHSREEVGPALAAPHDKLNIQENRSQNK